MLTLLGAAGFLVGLAVVVPLLAYGLSALLDRIIRGGGDEGPGGLPVPARPGPPEPPEPMTRSAELDQEDD